MFKKLSQLLSDYMPTYLIFLYAFLLPTQFGKHFWPDYAYLHGIKIDYLAPFISVFDIVCILIVTLSLPKDPANYLSGLFTRLRLFRKTLIKTVIPDLIRNPLAFIKSIQRQPNILHLFLLLILILNTFFSFSPLVTLFKIIKILLYSMAGYKVIKSMVPGSSPGNQKRVEINYFTYGIFVSTLLVFILAAWQFVTKSSVGGLWYFLGEREITLSLPGVAKMAYGGKEFLRPYSLFSHPNSMGGFYLVLYFLIDRMKNNHFVILPARQSLGDGGSLPKHDRVIKLLLFTAQILSLFLIILSFSKVAIGAFVLISFIKLINDKAYKGCIICFAARTSIFVFLLFFIFFFSGDPYTLDKRLFLTTQSLEIIKNNLLLGVGIGASIVAQSQLGGAIPGKFTDTLQPVHNIYLLLISEIGFVGVMILVYTIFVIFRQSQYDKNVIEKLHSYWQELPVAAISAILITGLFDHYWLTLPQNIALMCLILSIIILSSRHTTPKADEGRSL